MSVPRRVYLTVQPRLPATVTGSGPISVTRTGRDYSVTFTPGNLATLPLPASAQIMVRNTADSVLSNISFASFSDAVFTETQSDIKALIGTSIVAGSNVTVAYNSGTGLTTIAAAGGGTATTNIAACVNIGVAQSVASGALTVNLTTAAGATPSGADFGVIPFRSATAGDGTLVARNISTTHNITLPSGSTLGVPSTNKPFAVWIVAFDDGGTVRLGAINCVSGLNVFPLGGVGIASSTLVGAGSTATHTFYSAGSAVTGKAYTIIARLGWSSGLSALGTWVAPTHIDLARPGLKLPGDVVQTVQSVKTDTFQGTTTGSLTDITGLSATITPTRAANIIRATPRVQATEAASNGCAFSLIRGSTNIGGGTAAGSRISAIGGLVRGADTVSTQTITAVVYDDPGTTSATTYKVQYVLQAGTLNVNRTANDPDSAHSGRYSSSITLEEIMT